MSDYGPEVRVWIPYIAPVAPAQLTDKQRDALRISGKLAHQSRYYRVLVHDPDSLVARTRLYDQTMRGDDGLTSAEREFAALRVSMTNGCKYCASVHSRRLAELTDASVVERACERSCERLNTRESAVARLCDALTGRRPDQARATTRELRDLGLSAVEVFDLVGVIAIFAWANRLMLGLGHSVRKEEGNR